MMLENPTEVRPWGTYRNLIEQDGYLVKLIEVEPGKRLSLQRHLKRAEYWTVIRGKGLAEVDGQVISLVAGTTVHVPCSSTHRMQAAEDASLLILELQTGECREDDIERLEDDFGRA
jgi:mannose-6-phosphate isomerase-like protein (cupin superfamily)